METIEELIDKASRAHGHLCPGQILGVRMAMLGCRRLGFENPKDDQRLIVFVEIDRCAADAVGIVTGCRLGMRTLKFFDYGKVAATFLNMASGEAVRVVALDSSRQLAQDGYPHLKTKKERQMMAYRTLADELLFKVEAVSVQLAPEDKPGRPIARTVCGQCGEGINDRREVMVEDRILCRACAGRAYFTRENY